MHSPIPIGSHAAQSHTFTRSGALYPLTGIADCDIEWHCEDRDKRIDRVCSGTWEMTDAASGKAVFTPSKEEVSWGLWSREGTYKAYPVVIREGVPVVLDGQALTFKKGG